MEALATRTNPHQLAGYLYRTKQFPAHALAALELAARCGEPRARDLLPGSNEDTHLVLDSLPPQERTSWAADCVEAGLGVIQFLLDTTRDQIGHRPTQHKLAGVLPEALEQVFDAVEQTRWLNEPASRMCAQARFDWTWRRLQRELDTGRGAFALLGMSSYETPTLYCSGISEAHIVIQLYQAGAALLSESGQASAAAHIRQAVRWTDWLLRLLASPPCLPLQDDSLVPDYESFMEEASHPDCVRLRQWAQRRAQETVDALVLWQRKRLGRWSWRAALRLAKEAA